MAEGEPTAQVRSGWFPRNRRSVIIAANSDDVTTKSEVLTFDYPRDKAREKPAAA